MIGVKKYKEQPLLSASIYIYLYIHTHTCIYIYIYIYEMKIDCTTIQRKNTYRQIFNRAHECVFNLLYGKTPSISISLSKPNDMEDKNGS